MSLVVQNAYASEQTFTTTSLQSLASSPTAGWGGAVVDNTTTDYLDALVQFVFAAVNTAPSASKGLFLFAYAGSNATDLTTTGTSGGTVGTQGTLTFPDVTVNPYVMPSLQLLPYTTQNKQIVSPLYSIASVFGGRLPPFWGICVVNNSGMTLAASGNTVKWRGVTETIT